MYCIDNRQKDTFSLSIVQLNRSKSKIVEEILGLTFSRHSNVQCNEILI